MKIQNSKMLSRRLLLAFLIFVIILTLAALIVRYTVSQKLKIVVTQVNKMELTESKPERILILMHQAENDFQESFLGTDYSKDIAYKTKLLTAFTEIDSLLNTGIDSSMPYAAQYVNLKEWYTKKVMLSGKLNILRIEFDSFLMVYSDFKDGFSPVPDKNTIVTRQRRPQNSELVIDTVRRHVLAKKRKLFGRIKDAILNKSDHGSETLIRVYPKELDDSLALINEDPFKYKPISYINMLQKLHQQNADMQAIQKKIIELNTHISREVSTIVNELNSISIVMAIELKRAAIRSYQDSMMVINTFCVIALIMVLLFAVLLIVYVLKLNKSEVILRQENERAISIAQQKMDLLHHMSHEIRNPISSIQGFLYVFGQTSLSDKQSEILYSIKLASNTLMNTVNDVLAAAKMEHSEFVLSKEPFNPNSVLLQITESMRFSATQKNICIDYEFLGDKETILLGDQFRLEQILTNLLSNAIKYTDRGCIHIKSNLVMGGGKQWLQVNVSDTGIGIAVNEQPDLFSKYYQTSSAKGKIGTGLGLYICKSFIELQGGTISLTSSFGKGSTFSFNIPFDEGNKKFSTKANVLSDQRSLLNGMNILAVDDSLLSLKFLKMITFDWNVNFFFAKNGKIALDIITKESISVVFTDINMPDMDGFELLAAIRKLPHPLGSLPVIAMNGDLNRYNQKMLLKRGFSAAGEKPIMETQLTELIIKVLKL